MASPSAFGLGVGHASSLQKAMHFLQVTYRAIEDRNLYLVQCWCECVEATSLGKMKVFGLSS